MVAPRISVVIPTYQRRDVVAASVEALGRVDAPWPVEIVVVVDGSTDGTAAALAQVTLPFPLRVVTQPNRGRAAAANHGARVATGDILLFLDDDMEADRRLLVAHEAALRTADAVVGHIPLHPDSPPSIISRGVSQWARDRYDRLAGGGRIGVSDLLTGQLSIARAAFESLGGFDERFTEGGTFGGEDIDFLHRLANSGLSIAFAGDAISWQRYVVTPAAYLRQWHQAGASEAGVMLKHPELAPDLRRDRRIDRRVNRVLWKPLLRHPRLARPARAALRRAAVRVAGRPRAGARSTWFFFRVRDLEYLAGLREASGALGHDVVRVLAYHAISDVTDPLLRRYCVPPEEFESQLRALTAAGCNFIDGDAFDAWLGGAPVPARAVLVTFDDGYRDLVDALPTLRRHGVPAVTFAVAGLTGATNKWDQARGTTALPLLSADELRAVAAGGVEVGSHSRSHADLVELDDVALQRELDGALDDLEAIWLPRPRYFAYPYGSCDRRVADAVRASGVRAAFALYEVAARAGGDPMLVPRFEVQRGTSGRQLVRRLFDLG